MKNQFIVLTRSHTCETILVNLDSIKFIEPCCDSDGTFIAFTAIKSGHIGISVVESVREVAELIDNACEVH